MRYLIIVEKTPTGYSSYSPDVPGCVATAPSAALVERRMRSAIRFHIEGLRLEGSKRPTSRAYAKWVEIRV